MLVSVSLKCCEGTLGWKTSGFLLNGECLAWKRVDLQFNVFGPTLF